MLLRPFGASMVVCVGVVLGLGGCSSPGSGSAIDGDAAGLDAAADDTAGLDAAADDTAGLDATIDDVEVVQPDGSEPVDGSTGGCAAACDAIMACLQGVCTAPWESAGGCVAACEATPAAFDGGADCKGIAAAHCADLEAECSAACSHVHECSQKICAVTVVDVAGCQAACAGDPVALRPAEIAAATCEALNEVLCQVPGTSAACDCNKSQLGCAEAADCLAACGDDVTCTQDCFAQAAPTATGPLSALAQCAAFFCTAGWWEPQCIAASCSPEAAACSLNGNPGACVDQCDDQDQCPAAGFFCLKFGGVHKLCLEDGPNGLRAPAGARACFSGCTAPQVCVHLGGS